MANRDLHDTGAKNPGADLLREVGRRALRQVLGVELANDGAPILRRLRQLG